MDHRNSRKQIAERTLQELKQGYYTDKQGNRIAIDKDVQLSIEGSQFYSREELNPLLTNQNANLNSTAISVVHDSTLGCLYKVYNQNKKVALLNFASAKNPGGGFLGGSQAQEESLARSGSLYPTLLQHPQYYESNKRSSDTFYNDNLIYSPQVVFFKTDDGEYLQSYVKADVITMPAVNRGALRLSDEKVQVEIDDVMKRRMKYVLAISEENKVDILILGAWGCGVFKNAPEKIAENFKEVLIERRNSSLFQVIFAVLDRDGKTFGAFEPLSRL